MKYIILTFTHGSVRAVLDGDIDLFVEAYLRTGGGHAVSAEDAEE